MPAVVVVVRFLDLCKQEILKNHMFTMYEDSINGQS